MSDYAFDAIGTVWSLRTDGELPAEAAADLRARIDEYDAVYSRFREDSLVSEIARRPGRFTFPADAIELFDVYVRLYRLTGGAMSPLVGRSLERLGYDPQYSLVPHGDPIPAPSWDLGFQWHGLEVTVDDPVLIDVGAAGKGHLVDLTRDVLTRHGITEVTINAGGDIVHSGAPIRVALEHPEDPTKAMGVALLDPAAGFSAICASSGNRRTWGRGLHHILDARTGEPTTDIVATWAIADSGLIADALATALFFADPAVLAAEFDFAFVAVHADGTASHSTNFRGEVFA